MDKKPKSGGALRQINADTFRLTRAFIVPTNTFGRGSTNHLFKCPRIAGGTSLAIMTVI